MDEKVKGRVIDAHSHIGTMDAWKFYNLKEPVQPTVYQFANAKAYMDQMDSVGVERGLILPNYGIPVQSQPFSLNDLVLGASPTTTGSSAVCGCRSSRRTRR